MKMVLGCRNFGWPIIGCAGVLLALASFVITPFRVTHADISSTLLKPNFSTRTTNTSAIPTQGFSRESEIESLSKSYKEIAKTALVVENWPEGNSIFFKDEDGVFTIPSFPEEDAPLAVVAMLDRNENARNILSECGKIFASFLSDLRAALVGSAADYDSNENKTDAIGSGTESFVGFDNTTSSLTAEIDRCIWRVPVGTHHITVAVFQEHPSILARESDKQKWRRVEEDVAEEVFSQVSSYQEENSVVIGAPILHLESLLLTRDGALLAGFVDTSPSSSFQHLRTSALQIAASIVDGDLTSRPKNLIHVTLGRLLALPEDLSDAQRTEANSLVRRYNTEILPAQTSYLHESIQPQGATFELTELTMIRDIVWTLQKIREYGSWTIDNR